MTFLGQDPVDFSHKWEEWHIQAYVVQEARREGFLVTADMAAGQRSPLMAKAVGLLAGHPDLSFWLQGGRIVLVELKTSRGKLSKAQKRHQEALAVLGHAVHTVFATCPVDGWEKVQALLA